MKTSLIRFNLSSKGKSRVESDTIATLGNFDGLHLGHQEILKQQLSIAGKRSHIKTVLLSFYPHPQNRLGNQRNGLLQITPTRQKLELLNTIGIEILGLLHFTTEMANLSAGEFIERVLKRGFKVKHLLVGTDIRIGKDRHGDISTISRICSLHDIKVTTLNLLTDKTNSKISSRTIRQQILNGEMAEVALSLGRPYELIGRVIKGAGRGSRIGIPTANIHTKDQILPPNGVYVSRIDINNTKHKSITNIGVRPTFDGDNRTVETHLLDLDGINLYNSIAKVELLEKIRDEKRFDSAEHLVDQIKKDIESARVYHDKQDNH